MKIDDQLKQMFPDPKDIWDWRIIRATSKKAYLDWKEMDSRIIRNICKEIQYLLWSRVFGNWSIDTFDETIDSDDYTLQQKYLFLLEHNRSRQEITYINRNLQKLVDIIQDNILMQYPDVLFPEIDNEGNLYFEHRYYKKPGE